MKWFVGSLLSTAVLFGAESNAQRGRRIVDEALAALGGDKFLEVQDRIEEGRAYSFYRERLTGLAKARIYTRYLQSAGPDQIAQRERQTFGKDEDYYILFLENKAYSVTFRGAQPLPDDRWDRYFQSTRRNILYMFRQRFKEPGLLFDSRGSSVWLNTPVEIVDITDADNNVVTVYFHASTKLPIRETWTVRDPKTRERTDYSTIFSKYRDVGGGVQWPWNVLTERNGDKIFELFSDSVTINQGLTDDQFTLNSKTKMLPSESGR